LPFKDLSAPFRDILASIEKIERFVARMDIIAFSEDEKTVSAVERELQKISEAAVRLGQQAEQLCPGPPWADIRGIGNWLRHQYDRVDLETIWTTVERDLVNLKPAVQLALTSLAVSSNLSKPAIE
jgi:uncharacterized protein with HEPN domain